MVIELPLDYHGSILDWAFRIHELEHAIQHAALETGVSRDDLNEANLKSKVVEFIFLLEEGAMSAEWEFLHNIPEVQRTELVNKIKADKSLPESEKKFGSRMLINSSYDRETYLRLEWEAGRYSRREIHFHFVTLPIIGKTIAIGSVASSHAFLAQVMYCFTGLVFDRPDSDSIPVLQKVCRMIGLGKDRSRATQFRGDSVRPLQYER